MAKTFTEQANVPGTGISGTSWSADGDGLHSSIYFDAIRGLNNISSRVNNFASYAQSIAGGTCVRIVNGAAREVFMAQFPVLVPPWRQRLLWMAGVTVNSGSIASASVYVSPDIYTGLDDASNSVAFDATNIPHAAVHSISVGSSSGYSLVDDSSTGVSPLPTQLWAYEFTPTFATVIVTITSGTTDSVVELDDFTCWWAEE